MARDLRSGKDTIVILEGGGYCRKVAMSFLKLHLLYLKQRRRVPRAAFSTFSIAVSLC